MKAKTMQPFTHESTRYTVAPENVAKYRAALEKPKKHKPEALKPVRREYPDFYAGMSTFDYVALFQRQFDGIQHKIEHGCENYHKPAQTVAGLKTTIRAALELIASGDIDSAQCLLNEAIR